MKAKKNLFNIEGYGEFFSGFTPFIKLHKCLEAISKFLVLGEIVSELEYLI